MHTFFHSYVKRRKGKNCQGTLLFEVLCGWGKEKAMRIVLCIIQALFTHFAFCRKVVHSRWL